jgi:hypothetical protein
MLASLPHSLEYRARTEKAIELFVYLMLKASIVLESQAAVRLKAFPIVSQW